MRQILRLPGKTVRVMVEGQRRAVLRTMTQTEPYLEGKIVPVEEEKVHIEGKPNSLRTEAVIRRAYELFDRYTELSPKNATTEMLINVHGQRGPRLYCGLSSPRTSPCGQQDKQAILEELRPVRRLAAACTGCCTGRWRSWSWSRRSRARSRSRWPSNQRDYFLREQMKAIQDELGEGERRQTRSTTTASKIAERPPARRGARRS